MNKVKYISTEEALSIYEIIKFKNKVKTNCGVDESKLDLALYSIRKSFFGNDLCPDMKDKVKKLVKNLLESKPFEYNNDFITLVLVLKFLEKNELLPKNFKLRRKTSKDVEMAKKELENIDNPIEIQYRLIMNILEEYIR